MSETRRSNDGWSALIVFGCLGALFFWLLLSRILLRYRFDGGWFKALLWGAAGGLFCLGAAFIIKNRHRHEAVWGHLTKLELGACAVAWLPLLLLGLVYLPPVRQALTVLDHRFITGPDYDKAYHGGWGLALPSHYFDAKFGPLLARDEAVILNRAGKFAGLLDFGQEEAFCYAALRAQGWTPERIAQHPNGDKLFLAALEAENMTPAWWSQMPWLTSQLKLQPKGSLHLGLLNRADTQAQVATLTDRFDKLADEAQRALVKQTVQAHLDLLTQPQTDALLEKWAMALTKRIYRHEQAELTEALAGRKQLRALAARVAAQDGTVEVSIAFPSYFTEDLQQAYRDVFYDLLASCGYWAVPGEKLRLDLRIEPRRFAQVALDNEVKETRPETVTRTVRNGNRTRTVSETVNRTRTVTKTSLESAEVPTLFIHASAAGSQITLTSAPYRSVGRQATTAMNALLRQSRVTLDEKATDYLRSVPPGPWRLGL